MKDIDEAKRYLSNAKDILREKGLKEDGFYKDRKYVKMAGHTAYTGVLVALDSILGNKRKGRKSVDWYKEGLSARDKKMLNIFLAAYDVVHLSMSYDGVLSAAVSKEGFELAEQIINWAEQRAVA
jgi:RsiW-degrading membrane proteinase PrsW (M82 family)